MTITKISSREFNQDISRAKRAAQKGPVIITDRGQPAYVLMRHSAFLRLAGKGRGIRDLLDLPGAENIEFDPPRMGEGIFRPADMS